jgi:hypothetical protein
MVRRSGMFCSLQLAQFLLVTACASAPEESVEQRCERLRDHVIERQLADASAIDRTKHAKAMRTALGSTFITRCASELTEAQRQCVLGAQDSFAINNCSNI